MKWFNNPTTLEELKKEYKKLCMAHHPDLGGDTASMQAINNEYETLFEKLKNVHKNSQGEAYTKKTEETPEQFKEIINTLIHLNGIEIEICGSWIWLTGNTKEHKEILKDLKFRYASKKKAWYYHTEPYHKRGKELTLDEIRAIYGIKRYKKNDEKELALQG